MGHTSFFHQQSPAREGTSCGWTPALGSARVTWVWMFLLGLEVLAGRLKGPFCDPGQLPLVPIPSLAGSLRQDSFSLNGIQTGTADASASQEGGKASVALAVALLSPLLSCFPLSPS